MTAEKAAGASDPRGALTAWLARRVDVDGGSDAELGELTSPNAGYSGKTLFARASWTDARGARQAEELVFRVQQSDHQLFVAPDALRQARTMRALAGTPGVPVPRILYTEADESVLGAPFYVMVRVHGRVPGDVPSWHATGWTVALTPDQRTRLYDNGLGALVALHRAPVGGDLQFLAEPATGTALERYLARLEGWYEWCGPSRRFDPDTLAEGVRHLLDHRPEDPAEGVVWGDARPGNISFADDLSVGALFDWETATTGPPGIDLGWWLMFERFLCEAQGLTRLEGVPDRERTLARYAALGGAPVPDIDYYELVAGVVMTLISSRLADVLVQSGRAPEKFASIFPLRAVGLVRESLDRLRGRPALPPRPAGPVTGPFRPPAPLALPWSRRCPPRRGARADRGARDGSLRRAGWPRRSPAGCCRVRTSDRPLHAVLARTVVLIVPAGGGAVDPERRRRADSGPSIRRQLVAPASLNSMILSQS
ncbi:MAG: hypothetical protein JWO98_5217 [Frankiales bacterium]|nr:hypothetical protein [Frankiales bacterium]